MGKRNLDEPFNFDLYLIKKKSMQTKFTFIINYIEGVYFLIAKSYNDDGEIASSTEQDTSIEGILAKQEAFYNFYKTTE